LAYNLFFVVVVVSFSGFEMSVILASENEFGSVLSLSISWKSLKRVGIISSSKVW
jgi:hypothetical protein